MLGKSQTGSSTISVAQRKSNRMPDLMNEEAGEIKSNLDDLKKFSYHFVCVGGIGMSAIAQILRGQGHTVSGSDRNHDRKITPEIFQKLQSQGISLYPQNGSGVKQNTDFIVYLFLKEGLQEKM